MTTVVIYALLMVSATPAEAEWDKLRARVEAAPPPVAAFIERRAGCNHFWGEDPYDRERAQQIDAALRKLRCNRLDADERALRRTYRRQPAVLVLITDTAEISGW